MASNLSALKTAQPCGRCGVTMEIGTYAFWSNLGKRWYHPKGTLGCVSQAGAATVEAEEPEATQAPKGKASGGLLEEAIGAMIEARLGSWTPDAAISEDKVREIVAQSLGQSLAITLTKPDGTVERIEGAHFMFERAVKLANAGISLYFWGPPGSGKTTLALAVGKAIAGRAELDTMDPSTPKSALLGYRTPTGEPVHTALTRNYGEGGAIVIDEVDNSPAHVQSNLNSALANGHCPAAWGSIVRHSLFLFMATGNTPGRPTPAFPDRRPMSQAFADRLYFMHVPMDRNIMRRAAGLPLVANPERDGGTCSPQAWTQWIEAVMAWTAQNLPTLMVTPRAALVGIKALACGESPREAADGLVFRGADDATVAKILKACPLPC